MREPIEPSERLCVTLRYCVTGDAHVTIAASYRIIPSCVGRIIAETCQAIWSVICKKGLLDVPCTENEWTAIANEFEYKWNFPHAIGALDGKHVVMQTPHSSSSTYFNYKKTHSIVLLTVCNASYEILVVKVTDLSMQIVTWGLPLRIRN